MLSKPTVYISLKEIVDTHHLLLEHEETICPHSDDPLHAVLRELGESPDIEPLLADTSTISGSELGSVSSMSQVGKAEVCLILTNKYEPVEDDYSNAKSLCIKTKKMIVDLIRCQKGDTLSEILHTPASPAEEAEYRHVVQRRVNQKTNNAMEEPRDDKTLADVKRIIVDNLKQLEMACMVSSHNNYQSIINLIASDIRNQRRYRQRRRQDIVKLRSTLQGLRKKATFYQEQIDYYNQYVKMCLDNLTAKGKKKRYNPFRKSKSQIIHDTVKYSAAKLHEKGVILEIEGLPVNQFKNVVFEINTTETAGVFEVSAKFMGVAMEKVELIFQDLLQLQYEGLAVMKMFDRAKINVNLLIFLLNKKFYGR